MTLAWWPAGVRDRELSDALGDSRMLAGQQRYWDYRARTVPGEHLVAELRGPHGTEAIACVLRPNDATPMFANARSLLTGGQFERRENAEELGLPTAERPPGDLIGDHLLIRGFDDSGLLVSLAAADRADSLRRLVAGIQDYASERGLGVVVPFVAATEPVVATTLEAAGFARGIVTAACVLDTRGMATADDFLAALDRKRRGRIRREFREFAESGLRMQLLAPAEWAERIGELECATHERHGQAADIRRTAAKRRLLAELFGSDARLLGVLDGDRLLACGCHVIDGSFYYTLTYGADYTVPDRSHSYHQIGMYAPLKLAVGAGLTGVRLGFEGFQAKYLRGASIEPRTCHAWSPEPERQERVLARLSVLDRINRAYLSGAFAASME